MKQIKAWRIQFEQACLQSDDAVMALLEAMETEQPLLARKLKADLQGSTPPSTDDSPEGHLFDDVHPLPEAIGNYRLIERIGSGGMSDVYLAHNLKLNRSEALKIIRLGKGRNLPFTHGDLDQEAVILARLNNIHIVHINDMGLLDRQPWFAMDYIEGPTITDYADRHCYTLEKRIELMIQICEGVAHAHGKMIIHGDLKPPNILVEEHSGKPIVKIIDFGVAELLKESRYPFERGPVFATPLYAHPNRQIMDGDVQNDLYSLGVVFYELLTGTAHSEYEAVQGLPLGERWEALGQRARKSPTVYFATGGLTHDVVQKRGTSPRQLLKKVRGELDRIVMKAFDGEGYPSVEALQQDLSFFLTHRPTSVMKPSFGYHLRKFVFRRPLISTLSVFLLLFLLSGMLGLLYSNHRITDALMREELARKKAEQISARLTKSYQFFEDMLISPHPYGQGENVRFIDVLEDNESLLMGPTDQDPQLRGKLCTTLGNLYFGLGQYRKAVKWYSVTLALQKADPDLFPDKSIVKDRMGRVLFALGQIDQAADFIQEALEERRRLYGAQSAPYLQTRIVMASILKGQLRTDAAVRMANETWNTLMISRGIDQQLTQEAALVLANCLKQQGDEQTAIHILEETLAAQEQQEIPNQVVIAKTRYAVASNYHAQGRLDEAAHLLEQVIETREKLLGAEHPETVNALYEQALVGQQLGHFEEAGKLLEAVVAIRTRKLGPLHGETLKARNARCVTLGSTQVANAIPCLEELLADYVSIGMGESPVAQSVRNNLGDFLIRANRAKEGLVHLRKCLEIKKKLMKPGHISILKTQVTMAEALLKLGQIKEAKILIKDAFDVCQGNDRLKALFGGYYGLALMYEGGFDESEQVLLKSLGELPPESDYYRQIGHFLWQMYDHWGKPERRLQYDAFRE